MASVNVTASTAPVLARNGLSKSVPCTLRVSVAGVGILPSGCITYGKAASAPATHADLTNPVDSSFVSGDSASYSASGGLFSGSYVDLGAQANAAWAVGDKVWVCVFESAAPSGGDVPEAVSAPILVIA